MKGTLALLLVTSVLSSIAIADNNNPPLDIQADGQITGLTSVTTNKNPTTDENALPERKILYSVTQNDYIWKNGPASFPRGTTYAVLEGDPYGKGPYTIRIKFPPNYKLPAHAHEDLEELTVISGELHIALGDQLKSGEGLVLPAGGFTVLAPNVNHYVWTSKEGAVLQIHGVGPRTSMYVDKRNDPTWKKQLQLQNQVTSHQEKNTVKNVLAVSLKNVAIKEARHSAIQLSERTIKPISKPKLASSVKSNVPLALEIKTVSSNTAIRVAQHSNQLLIVANSVEKTKRTIKPLHEIGSVVAEKSDALYQKNSLSDKHNKSMTVASKKTAAHELLLN